MTEKTNQLDVILKEQGLDESNSKAIIEAFGGPFEEAGNVLATYQEIKVTDESDIAGMTRAKEARLVLKKARTTAENGRKALKADIIKQGRAIDNVARFVKETIEPAESYLKLQEDFAKIAQEKRDAEKKTKRLERLAGFEVDTSIYNIDLMTDEAFDNLVENLTSDRDRAEAERLAADKKAAEEAEAEKQRQLQVEAENARLRAEAEEKEAHHKMLTNRVNSVTELGLSWDSNLSVYKDGEIQITPNDIKDCNDEQFASLLKVASTYIEGIKQIEARKLEEQQIAAEADRAERERLEKEATERAEAEAKARQEAEAAERAALLAPDKDKIHDFLGNIDELVLNHKPAVTSEEAMAILSEFHKTVAEAIGIATEKTEKL